MPNRIIREGILDSDRIESLVRDQGWESECFYRRLLSVVDDYGRFDGRMSVIRAKCYPTLLDLVREVHLERWIAACVKARLIRLYTVQDKTYVEVRDFKQALRQKTKRFPDPPPDDACEADATQMLRRCDADAPLNRIESNRIEVESNRTPKKTSSAETSIGNVVDQAFDEAMRGIAIPPALDTPDFRKAMADWRGHILHMTGRELSVFGEREIYQQVAPWGPDRAIAAIKVSMRGSSKTIYEERAAKNGTPRRGEISDAELDEIIAASEPKGKPAAKEPR